MNTSDSPLPTYQDMMLPILQVLAKDGKLHQKDYAHRAADLLNIGETQRLLMLPSGAQPIFYNRAGWAVWYLMQAGLLTSEQVKLAKKTMQQHKENALDKHQAVTELSRIFTGPSVARQS